MMISKKMRTLGTLSLVLGGLYLISPYRVGIVCGESMTPSLQSGRPLLIDRLAYRNQAPRRGDVVVFEQQGVTYVKRVAAVEGDRFCVFKYREGGDERPLRGWEVSKLTRCFQLRMRMPGRVVNRRLPSGWCYVLGDEMMNSEDSRHLGPISVEQIRGKILFAPEREPDLEMASSPSSSEPKRRWTP